MKFMAKFIKNKLSMAILLIAFIFIFSFPGLGIASSVKAAPENNWTAQTLYKARP